MVVRDDDGWWAFGTAYTPITPAIAGTAATQWGSGG
jgi:hypothetical protein